MQVDEVTVSVFGGADYCTCKLKGVFVMQSFMKFFELRDALVHADEVFPPNDRPSLRNSVFVGYSECLDFG